MTIQQLQDALKHFKDNGVSHDPKHGGLQKVLDYQDLVARSTIPDTCAVYDQLPDDEKKLFHWVNFLTLSMDLALELVRETVIGKIQTESLSCFKDDLVHQSNQIDKLNKQVAKLTEENECLTRRVDQANYNDRSTSII